MLEINRIGALRRKAGFTQKELAARAGVSQSMIAKIESGKLDPAYSKVVKIFSALESHNRKHGRTASDIMVKRIIRISPEDTIKKAIRRMKKYNISQLPVFDEKQAVGLISEMIILDAMSEIVMPTTLVKDIMDEAPPTITPSAELSSVLSLLKQYPLLIVSVKGTPKGIITKADLVIGLNL